MKFKWNWTLNFVLIIVFKSSCSSNISHAANVDTIAVFSNKMHKTIQNTVIYPDTTQNKHYPVLYLLHGHGGNYSVWLRRFPELKLLADENKMIIVCPDGEYSSWYVDSPVDSTMQYETYISKELVNFIDQHYPTEHHGNKSRAITGYSMGGYGAMFLALHHPDVFGACGSMSGALNLSYIKQYYDLGKRLGDTITNTTYYTNWSIINMLNPPPPKSMSIIMDCGTEDFIYGMSKEAHAQFNALKIPHEYIERSGQHDWIYWRNAIKYQAKFFRNFFRE